MIVFTDEDHGELPYGGKVHGLTQSALIAAAVAEERDADAVGRVHRAVERIAGAERLRRANDAVCTHKADLGCGLMHFAGAAAAVALLLAHQLGHHGVDVRALGDEMAVAAVRRGDVVLTRERTADAGGCGLFADVHVHVADDDALFEIVNSGQLKITDQIHGAVHFDQILPRQTEFYIILSVFQGNSPLFRFIWHVDCAAFRGKRRLADRLRHGRVRVDRVD